MFREILVAIDDSACAQRALGVAIALAAEQHAHLAICTVVDPVPILGGAAASPMASRALAASRDEAKALVDAAAARATAAGIATTGTVHVGKPALEIGAHAAKARADAIVLGTHARSGLKRLVEGSVAETVLRGASVPVVIVPDRAAGKGSTAPLRTPER